jgi:predicted transcriptional regulator
MADPRLEIPVIEEVEVDAKSLAAIDRGIADADVGRIVPLEDVQKLVPQWISKFNSRKPR